MLRKTLGVLLCALVLAVPAFAQEQRGSIEGVVKDAQGGVLPGVTVEAKNQNTGAAISTVTDGSGVFRFPSVAPGVYDVTATLAGFQSGRFDSVQVLLGQIKKLDFGLAVAGLTEEV